MKRDIRIFFARVAAYLVDVIILSIIFFLLNFFVPFKGEFIPILENIITLAYFIYFNWKTGQTYGKKAFYIKVVNYETDLNISLSKSFIREFI